MVVEAHFGSLKSQGRLSGGQVFKATFLRVFLIFAWNSRVKLVKNADILTFD